MGSRGDRQEVLREEYMEWLRYPDSPSRKKAGLPGTRVEFAEKHKIHRTTLFRWESDPEFKREMLNKNLNTFTADQINAVLNRIYEDAIAGKTGAQNTFVRVAGIGNPEANAPVPEEEEVDFTGWSPEKIQEWMDAQDEREMSDA